MPCCESLDYLIEESRRQEAVVIAITAADFPKIIARPIELWGSACASAISA